MAPSSVTGQSRHGDRADSLHMLHATLNVPLLNQYKHALLRRRLLQTITGGSKMRQAPWYVHLIQLTLWIAPFLLAVPFIVISSLHLWNQYYIALMYGSLLGVATLPVEICRCIVSRYTEVEDGQLDDEDSADFVLDSCCSFETFDFIFARKKLHSLFLHPLVVGLAAFCGMFILQPSMMIESLHIAAVVIVSIIGWYTLCSAHYSLTVSAPQETATYRPTDLLDLRFLTRPFYIVAIAAIFIPLRLLVPVPSATPYLQLLYAFLCLLPLGWLVGFLPPLDALFPWIMEQGLTRLLGGSPMATDLRLAIMFVVSSVSVAIVASITSNTLSVLLATAFGFMLSQDVFTMIKSPIYLLSLILNVKYFQSTQTQITTKTFISLFGWDCRPLSSVKTLAIHYLVSVVKGTLLLATSLVIVYYTFTSSGDVEDLGARVTGGLVIGLFIVLRGSHSLQRVYLMQTLRNPLFPKQSENVSMFRKRRKLLHYLSTPGRVLHTYVTPILMISFVGFTLKMPNTSSSIPRVWCAIVALRILRKVWQNTSTAHFEVMVVALLHFIVPADNVWMSLGSGSQILIVGIAAEILQDFVQKTWFATTLFVNFVFVRKHRTFLPLNVIIVVGTFVFFPFLLAIIFISSAFSSPLLPVFTLPVFLISFPRTKRFWPSLINYASSYSNCEDSVYYQQSEVEIVKAIHRSISSGSISPTPGTYLLLRFEDRLSVVTFLEHGHGHCVLAIKGLELQETSCHSIEATRIDSIFEDAYDPGSKTCPNFWINTHFSNTLQAVDAQVIMVYSDAHNVLTGIIDQPSSLKRFSDNLLKSLVWVLSHHFMNAIKNEVHNEDNVPDANRINVHVSVSETERCPANAMCTVDGPKVTSDGARSAWTATREDNTEAAGHVSPQEIAKQADTLSWGDSISDLYDDMSLQTDKLNADTAFTLDAVDSLPGLIPQDRPLDWNELSPKTTEPVHSNGLIQSEVGLSAVKTVPISVVGELQQICDGRTENGIPLKWVEDLPLKYSQLSKLRSRFPADWLELLVNQDRKNTLSANLKERLIDLVIVCFAIADIGASSDVCGRRAEETKPFDIFEGFCGRFPYSAHSEWLSGDKILNSLLAKAYRYAVKLMYDEVSLGEVEDYSELAEYLESYDTDYFIGLESDQGWAEAIVSQTPHLFSIGRDSEKNVYTAHVLSLQPHVVHIGQLNPATVHGIWSDLSLELLYLTNDDEERYSIQAHPTLLRNLTVQTADPPLGYYVYSSGIIRIPCT